MAGQSPHIIHRQAGRPEGFQRQWGEPVQRHKWEEAGIIDWVLVSGIQGERLENGLSCLKARAYTEVLHRRDAAERWERRGAFARRCWWKVNHSCSVWTVICMLLAEASEKCVISGHMFRSSLSLEEEEFRPLLVASCCNINTQHSRQLKQRSYVAHMQSDSCHMNLTNYILFTCELSWRASKVASCAGIGLVSLSPSALFGPLLLLVLAVVGGRRVAGPPLAQLLPKHQETWPFWRSNNQSYSTWKRCKCTA